MPAGMCLEHASGWWSGGGRECLLVIVAVCGVVKVLGGREEAGGLRGMRVGGFWQCVAMFRCWVGWLVTHHGRLGGWAGFAVCCRIPTVGVVWCVPWHFLVHSHRWQRRAHGATSEVDCSLASWSPCCRATCHMCHLSSAASFHP